MNIKNYMEKIDLLSAIATASQEEDEFDKFSLLFNLFDRIVCFEKEYCKRYNMPFEERNPTDLANEILNDYFFPCWQGIARDNYERIKEIKKQYLKSIYEKNISDIDIIDEI